MAWESLRGDVSVQEAGIQYKSGKRIEQYRVSNDAIFLTGQKYIPMDTVEKIHIRRSMMNSGHCCGMAFPVYNLVVYYGGERPEKIMLEKEKNARKMAELILSARGEIIWEDYVPPYEKAQIK